MTDPRLDKGESTGVQHGDVDAPAWLEACDLAAAVDERCKGYSGAVFDGRYVYYVPLNNGGFHGLVTRYDTAGAFSDGGSWSVIDAAQLDERCRGFVNGICDGRYIYLVPFNNGGASGTMVRYDTRTQFASPQSWQVFDTTRIHARSQGFVGGVYDGRYVYLVPYQLDGPEHHGQVTRYDTHAPFEADHSWQVFDMTRVHADCRGYHAGLFDGRYVYFCPYLIDPDPPHYGGRVARLDTQQSFTSESSWASFDLATVHEDGRGFVGGALDGRYLYLAPYHNGRERQGQVARLDTKAGFTDPHSWAVFDTCTVHGNSRGFFGAVFAGRHVYFVPHCRTPEEYNGQVTRFYTRGSFTDPTSWSVYDLTRQHPLNKGFIGGVFDGRYVYLPPFETALQQPSGRTVRIDTQQQLEWS